MLPEKLNVVAVAIVFCQRAQYWERKYNTQNIVLFLINQIADILYVRGNVKLQVAVWQMHKNLWSRYVCMDFVSTFPYNFVK